METTNKTKINLSAYFILPLLKLNINSYGKDNFINSFVTKNREVVVHIKDSSIAGDYYNHENMIADVDEQDYIMIIYSLPEVWNQDFDMFIKSRYSMMSMFAKEQIGAHAKANGLNFKTPTGKTVKDSETGKLREETKSDKLYLGLYKSEVLKNHIEEQLDIKLSDEAELIDALSKDEFIEL